MFCNAGDKNKTTSLRLAAVCMALFLSAFLAGGCSQATRYKLLNFFFTGVPPPGEKKATAQDKTRGAAVTRAARKKGRPVAYPEPRFFVHGPYGSGQCELCHAVMASKPFRSGKSGTDEAPTPARKSIGPRLAAPLTELCLGCHTDKGKLFAQSRGLKLHTPVSEGMCVTCHSPHRTARRYMLLQKDSIGLCTTCHSMDKLQTRTEHKKNQKADCLQCHNAHMGKVAGLLRSSYDETRAYE